MKPFQNMKAYMKTEEECKMKKPYIKPSLEITEIETKDVITTSGIGGIFEDVDMMNTIGFGKIDIEIDLY